ncbi:PDR/VanB family oxidoreductase [Sphingomonas sp. CROZ-RG-20F-R02-07]|uniref:PDR/VanB family oxidoreductase n=1 Tax=Sphingomonas sp. CROZ-RG-20F-R02-07 TaxID=2914832 RepID=UPI001F5AEEDA|nr:PDR/VanB family oxidoreductase [Sphingomonas sp. CROZ-RG-20F-R02-07]
MPATADGWTAGRVDAIRDVTPTIREIAIALDRVPTCAPGSHLKVRVVADGRDDYRSYSVVGATPTGLRIAVKRQPDSRGGSAYMWTLSPGDGIAVAAPRCDFPLSHGAPHYLLLAGGVGITPMLAMAEQLARRGANLRMVYAARSDDEFAYREELTALLGERLALFAADRGEIVDIAAEIDRLPADGELYMCGPLGLMEAVRHAWEAAGRPRGNLRYETFGSSGSHPVRAFTVKVPRMNAEVLVRENESMLDALEAAGVEVVFECRRGECGLCAIRIVAADGPVDHRDVFLSARQHAENTQICACVSRVAGGSITIDPAYRGDDAFAFAGARA